MCAVSTNQVVNILNFNDNTLCDSCATIEEVILSLQSSSKKLFQRLLDDQMKINAESVTVTF